MKVKSFLLTALAASMVLVACDKNESDLNAPTDKSLKSVTIKLPNINQAVDTRATGKGMKAGQIALKDFKVFFLNASGECINDDVPTTKELGEGLTQPALYFSNNDVAQHVGSDKTTTYHFLPAATAKVVVVGNCGDANYADINKDYNVLNDGDSGEGITSDTEGHPHYPLYGESNLTLKTGTDDQSHNNVYTASVQLAPRIARFEIYGFEYMKDSETSFTYTNVELNKIALANYAKTYNLQTGVAGSKTAAPNETAMVWDWIESATAPWANEFTSYSLAQNGKKYVDGNNVSEDDTDGSKYTGNMITFGVTASALATDNPELLLSFYGVKDSNKTPLYLHGKFTSSEPFKAGKIYRVLFPIKDGSWDQPERCVELNVTVAEWSITVVTPEF
ncbi:hypothetical protein ACIXS0_17940 [Bacteroides fragilis]